MSRNCVEEVLKKEEEGRITRSCQQEDKVGTEDIFRHPSKDSLCGESFLSKDSLSEESFLSQDFSSFLCEESYPYLQTLSLIPSPEHPNKESRKEDSEKEDNCDPRTRSGEGEKRLEEEPEVEDFQFRFKILLNCILHHFSNLPLLLFPSFSSFSHLEFSFSQLPFSSFSHSLSLLWFSIISTFREAFHPSSSHTSSFNSLFKLFVFGTKNSTKTHFKDTTILDSFNKSNHSRKQKFEKWPEVSETKVSKMARYRSTTAIDTSKSDFNDFYEIASHPRTLLQPEVSSLSKSKKRRPFSSFFSNGLHVSTGEPRTPVSAGPTTSGSHCLQTPVIIREPSSAPILESSESDMYEGGHFPDTSGHLNDPNKRYMRRGSFILSSGWDKLAYDSDGGSSSMCQKNSVPGKNRNLKQGSRYHDNLSSNDGGNYDNNNCTSINYNDLSLGHGDSGHPRVPMIAKRTSSQLSSTTSGSDVTTSSARSDISDLNENMSIHSLHPNSYSSPPSMMCQSSTNQSSVSSPPSMMCQSSTNQSSVNAHHQNIVSHHYQRSVSTTSSRSTTASLSPLIQSLSSNHSTGVPSSPTPSISPLIQSLSSNHSTGVPSSPTLSIGGTSKKSTQSKLKRSSVVRSAHAMDNPSRPVQLGGRFGNPWDTWAPLRFTNILKWGLAKDKSNIPSKEVTRTFFKALPL